LLRRRAERLRKETGNPNITTEQELFRASFSAVLVETLVRPFRAFSSLSTITCNQGSDRRHKTEMLVQEPILLLMSLFIALIYGLLYAFFFSFPVVFGNDYHWSDSKVGLTFLSVIIGLLGALLVTPRLEKDYARRAAAKGGRADPEVSFLHLVLPCPLLQQD
jgi:hypothetical protein